MSKIPSIVKATLQRRKEVLKPLLNILIDNYRWDFGDPTPTYAIAQRIVDPYYETPLHPEEFIDEMKAVIDFIEHALENDSYANMSWIVRLIDVAGLLQGAHGDIIQIYQNAYRMEKEETRQEKIVAKWGRETKDHFKFTADHCRKDKVDFDTIKPYDLAGKIQKAYSKENGSENCPSRDTFKRDLDYLKTVPQQFRCK